MVGPHVTVAALRRKSYVLGLSGRVCPWFSWLGRVRRAGRASGGEQRLVGLARVS